MEGIRMESSILHGLKKEFAVDLTVADLLRDAFTSGDSNSDSIIYGDQSRSLQSLNSISSIIARGILEVLGPSQDKPVKIVLFMSSSDIAIAAAIAILKLGAACVPIDPETAGQTVELIVKSTNPSCFITRSNSLFDLLENVKEVPVLEIDALLQGQSKDSDLTPDERFSAVSTSVFVTYYNNECIEVSQYNFISRLLWERDTFPFKETETMCTFKNISQIEYWIRIVSALVNKVPVVIPPRNFRNTIRCKTELLVEKRVTRISLDTETLAATLYYLSLDEILKKNLCLKWIFCDSGFLSAELAEKCCEILHWVTLVNIYSFPTAALCFYTLDRHPWRSYKTSVGDLISLGLPSYNCNVHINDCKVDRNNKRAGYICIECAFRDSCSDSLLCKTKDKGFIQGDLLFFSDSDCCTFSVGGTRENLFQIESVIKEVPGVEDVLVCWEMFSCLSVSLIAFYSSATKVPMEDILVNIFRKLPTRLMPKLFPLNAIPVSPTRGGFDKHLLLESYQHGINISGQHDHARIMFTIADVLNICVTDVDPKKTFTELGGKAESAEHVCTELTNFGFHVDIENLMTPSLTLGGVIRDTSRTCCPVATRIYKTRKLKTDDFDTVSRILSECFTKKNRLDMSVSNKPENHIRLLQSMWKDVVDHGVSIVAQDSKGSIVAGAIVTDATYEGETEGVTEEFKAILKMHERLEEPILEAIRHSRKKVLNVNLVGTDISLSHRENLALVYLLYRELTLTAQELGYEGFLSMNSHLVTQIFCETYFGCMTLDSIEPRNFEYEGKKPFRNIKRGTLVNADYRPL